MTSDQSRRNVRGGAAVNPSLSGKDGFVAPSRLYVWAWLPGKTEPVVAGVLEQTRARFGSEPVLVFAYARSYRENPEAISLFAPELPLAPGTMDPTRPGRTTGGEFPEWRGSPAATDRSPMPIAGALRDAAPDGWGRRVINMRLAGNPDVELNEMAYLMNSGSDRTGALDFQESNSEYVARGGKASLEQLVKAAVLIERGEPLPDDLAAAAGHGTSIGGARPKALLVDGDRQLVAKFSSSTDDRPVVKAEAVGMMLARHVGVEVPDVEVVTSAGKDVLLIDRFDRTAAGGRRMVVSALTILGVREEEARYASYADLAQAIRFPGWADTEHQLRELYTRLVLNVVIGNTDDHLRNHAAFWNGSRMWLTPAYDVSPQRRSTTVATHAIGLTSDGQRASQLRVARAAGRDFLLTPSEAEGVIDHVVSTVNKEWDGACDEAGLTKLERDQLWGREFMNDYIFWPEA
jgi:serine/threonine-protein kinase HipA